MPLPHRRSIRLPGYDYAQAGAYFVTICTYHRVRLFGQVVCGRMQLSDAGQIVAEEWRNSAVIRQGISVDEFVVMPDHLHGIIFILDQKNQRTTGWGQRHAAHLFDHAAPPGPHTSGDTVRPRGPAPRSLGAIIGGVKSAASARINRSRKTPGQPVWHRNYHERIIPDDEALRRIRLYIRHNPRNAARRRRITTFPD